MIDRAGHVSGIVNIILENSIPIWMSEHRLQSSQIPMIVSSILFGQIHQKDKRQQWQAEQIIEEDEVYRHLIVQTRTTP